MSRKSDFDLLDEPEDVDDVDEIDGFHVVTGGGFYDTTEDIPFCDFGVGDKRGLCIKSRYSCHYEGCPTASPNW